MKAVAIRFFSPQDNIKPVQKATTKQTAKVSPTGSISATGKLILSPKTVEQLHIYPAARFRVGIEQGKRKIKSLYLIPTHEDPANTFELVKKTNGYRIALSLILQKGGVDYQQTPYGFTIHSFAHQDGVTGYELRLNTPAPKPSDTGKPRGRQTKKHSPLSRQPLSIDAHLFRLYSTQCREWPHWG